MRFPENLYQDIVPKKIRHDLGEYYTPRWLAELTIDETGYDGNVNDKILDPGCGSGTFLVEFINRIKNKSTKTKNSKLLEKIISNVIGFDVNPVAVLTARTNYVMAISYLLDSRNSEYITIPVYLTFPLSCRCQDGVGEIDRNCDIF